jgi:hypothetical protein
MNEHQQSAYDAALKASPFLLPLVDRLLSLGGTCAVVWNPDFITGEPFTKLLLQYGSARDGHSAILRDMEMSHCHQNAVSLAIRFPKKFERHIGYGLSDSLWRPHSFLVTRKTNQILETTARREKYFSIPIPIMDSERTQS